MENNNLRFINVCLQYMRKYDKLQNRLSPSGVPLVSNETTIAIEILFPAARQLD
jgi:UV DNA damage repair endonuclease